MGIIWGGARHIFFIHHVTWSVNPVCHQWGPKPFNPHDFHPQPRDLRHPHPGRGLAQHPQPLIDLGPSRPVWWQLNAGYLVSRVLSFVGLAWDLKSLSPVRAEVNHRGQARREVANTPSLPTAGVLDA